VKKTSTKFIEKRKRQIKKFRKSASLEKLQTGSGEFVISVGEQKDIKNGRQIFFFLAAWFVSLTYTCLGY